MAFGELALWFDGYMRECSPQGDWIFRSRLTYVRCFRKSVWARHMPTLARAECAEGELCSPVTLASLNHYFCPVSCVNFHVHVVIYMCVHCSKFHWLAYGGECAIRVYLVDWDSFQQTCCYTWPFSCLLIVHPISSSCIPCSANSHCLIFYMYLSIIFLSCYLEEEGSRQINIHIQTDSTDRLSSLTPPILCLRLINTQTWWARQGNNLWNEQSYSLVDV